MNEYGNKKTAYNNDRFQGYVRKESLEKLTLTGHTEKKERGGKYQVSYVKNLSKWIAEEGLVIKMKKQALLRAKNDKELRRIGSSTS